MISVRSLDSGEIDGIPSGFSAGPANGSWAARESRPRINRPKKLFSMIHFSPLVRISE